jgi:hypothetical protein
MLAASAVAIHPPRTIAQTRSACATRAPSAWQSARSRMRNPWDVVEGVTRFYS